MVRKRPAPQRDSAPKALRWRRLPRRDMRKPLTMTIKWRGGAEAWVEVHARGDVARLPGHVTIAELCMMANSQGYK